MMKTPVWKIEWNDEMSVGIPEINEDHKRFVNLINEFNRSILDRTDPNEIKKRLQLVLDDAVQHFTHEEKLFKQWQYPDADDHANKHAQAVATLQAINEKFITYGLEPEWIDAWLEIKDILIMHLLAEDMKYADYYQNSRASGVNEKV